MPSNDDKQIQASQRGDTDSLRAAPAAGSNIKSLTPEPVRAP
jgi:hypothetical protein